MSLFFKTEDKQAYKKLNQEALTRWREFSVPSVFSIFSVPIGIPVTIKYSRNKKSFVPEKVKAESSLLLPKGKIGELGSKSDKIGSELLSKLNNIEYWPHLDSTKYQFLDTFKVKLIVTCAASKLRSEYDVPIIKDPDMKRSESGIEMPTRKLPSRQEFLEQTLEIPTLYAYDVDQQILSPVHPLFDIRKMTDKFMLPYHDQNSVAYARMDPVSAFGMRVWAAPFYIRKRQGNQVMIADVGGKNLWVHRKFVICNTVTENRVVTLKTEKAK